MDVNEGTDFLPSLLPSFFPSILPSFFPSFLPSFPPAFLPSFLPFFFPSFLPSFLLPPSPLFLSSLSSFFSCLLQSGAVLFSHRFLSILFLFFPLSLRCFFSSPLLFIPILLKVSEAEREAARHLKTHPVLAMKI